MEKNTVKTPRTIQELKKEVAELEAQDTATTKRVSKQLALEGIETLDAHRVYDELNAKASIMENVSVRMYEREKELIERGDSWSDVYNQTAKSYAECAEMIREAMTDILRNERQEKRVLNLLKK